jgi:hypothetical protein
MDSDGHLVEDGGGADVDALGDLGPEVADELDAEQLSGAAVVGVAHRDLVVAGVGGLVVVGFGGMVTGLKPCRVLPGAPDRLGRKHAVELVREPHRRGVDAIAQGGASVQLARITSENERLADNRQFNRYE